MPYIGGMGSRDTSWWAQIQSAFFGLWEHIFEKKTNGRGTCGWLKVVHIFKKKGRFKRRLFPSTKEKKPYPYYLHPVYWGGGN